MTLFNCCLDNFFSRYFSLNPHDSRILYWLFLLSLIYLYNVLFVTYRLVFPIFNEKFWHFFLIIDIIADIYYYIDILVQIRTCYLNQGYIVISGSLLTRQYVFVDKTVFLDIFTVLPIDYFLYLQSHALPYQNIIVGVRVLRFLKYYRIRNFFNRMEARSDNPSIVEILSLFIFLLNWIHIVACIYFGLSLIIGFGDDKWVYPCTLSNVTNICKNASYGSSIPFGDILQQYCNSLHWGTQIVTTIGEVEGPVTNFEHVVVIFLLICGIYWYATLIGEVGNTIQTLNVNRTRYTTRLDNIKQYMGKFLIESNLQYMVVNLFDHLWTAKKGVDEQEILENLPKKLRAQIAYSANQHLLKENLLFQNQPLGFQIDLILRMKTQILLPNECIYRQGYIGNDMYIIREGNVTLSTIFPGNPPLIKELTCGNYFGLSCVINFDFIGRRREETAKAKGFCSIWVIEKRILLDVLLDYPIVMNYLGEYFKKAFFDPNIDKKRDIKGGLYTIEELNSQLRNLDQYRRELSHYFKQVKNEQNLYSN